MKWYRRRLMPVTHMPIGDFYAHGQGAPQDFAQAMNWYLKPAALGDLVR